VALLVIVHQAEDVHTGKLVAAMEEVELDGDGEAADLAAEYRLSRAPWRARGRSVSTVLPP